MPITAKEVNEAAGSAEARVARERSQRANANVARSEPQAPKRLVSKKGQPDPRNTVTREIERRRRGAPTPAGARRIETPSATPRGRAERESDKTWSRAGEQNQRRLTARSSKPSG